MENLAICSKILYDKDYLDAKKELKELEIKPKIFVKDGKEFKKRIDNFHKNIKKYIKYIDLSGVDMNYYEPIATEMIMTLPDLLEQELNILTDNKYRKWCKKKSMDVCTLLYSSLTAFDNIGELEKWNKNKICKYIYEYIITTFDNANNDDFFIFSANITCKKCKEKEELCYDEIQPDNLCYECRNIK
jgi:hypothetical protein